MVIVILSPGITTLGFSWLFWERTQCVSTTYASFQSPGFSKMLADGPVFVAAEIGCSCQYEPTPVPKTNLLERTVAQDSSSLMISLPKFSVELLFHISTKVGSCAHSFKTFMLITLFIHVSHDLFWNKGFHSLWEKHIDLSVGLFWPHEMNVRKDITSDICLYSLSTLSPSWVGSNFKRIKNRNGLLEHIWDFGFI